MVLLYIPYGTQSRAIVSPHFSKQHKQKGHREKGRTMHRRTTQKPNLTNQTKPKTTRRQEVHSDFSSPLRKNYLQGQ